MSIKQIVLASVAGLIALVVLIGGWTIVPYGTVGVTKTAGKLGAVTLSEGFHFKWPVVESVIKVNVQVQKAEAKATAVSKDIQPVNTDVTVNYSVNKASANALLQNVGTSYEATVISPALQEIIKAVTAKYSAEELVSKRDIVSTEISEGLSKRMLPYGLTINAINIVDFKFSDAFNASIEAKQVAAQNAMKAKNDLSRVQIEAEQKVAQAKAEAESLRLKKQEITQELIDLKKVEIQEKAVEKWDGHLPNITGGVTPFIDVTSDQTK